MKPTPKSLIRRVLAMLERAEDRRVAPKYDGDSRYGFVTLDTLRVIVLEPGEAEQLLVDLEPFAREVADGH